VTIIGDDPYGNQLTGTLPDNITGNQLRLRRRPGQPVRPQLPVGMAEDPQPDQSGYRPRQEGRQRRQERHSRRREDGQL
jgi:hypothetical protein